MKKTLLLVGLGVAIGYFAGFSDARSNKDDIVHRAVAHIEHTRGRAPNDVDATMEALEKK